MINSIIIAWESELRGEKYLMLFDLKVGVKALKS